MKKLMILEEDFSEEQKIPLTITKKEGQKVTFIMRTLYDDLNFSIDLNNPVVQRNLSNLMMGNKLFFDERTADIMQFVHWINYFGKTFLLEYEYQFYKSFYQQLVPRDTCVNSNSVIVNNVPLYETTKIFGLVYRDFSEEEERYRTIFPLILNNILLKLKVCKFDGGAFYVDHHSLFINEGSVKCFLNLDFLKTSLGPLRSPLYVHNILRPMYFIDLLSPQNHFIHHYAASIVDYADQYFPLLFIKAGKYHVQQQSEYLSFLMYMLNFFNFNIDGIIIRSSDLMPLPIVYLRDYHAKHFVALKNDDVQVLPRMEFLFTSVPTNEPLSFGGPMINNEENVNPLIYNSITKSLTWTQSSCHVDATLILLFFMASPYYRKNILNYNIGDHEEEYANYWNACQKEGILHSSYRKHIVTGANADPYYNKDRFVSFVIKVQQSLYALYDAIVNKKKTTCTVVRQTISMCLDDSMKHLRFDTMNTAAWMDYFHHIFPSMSKDRLYSLAQELSKLTFTSNASKIVNVFSKAAPKDNTEMFKSDINEAIKNFVEKSKIPRSEEIILKEKIYDAVIAKFNERREGRVGDPVDLYLFLGVIFPLLRIRFKYAVVSDYDEDSIKMHSVTTLDALSSYCNGNSVVRASDETLSKNDMIVFTNLTRQELFYPNNEKGSKAVTKPLALSIVLKPRPDVEYFVEFVLIGIVFLVKKKEDYYARINDGSGNHYTSSFLGVDGHWYHYNNAAFSSSMNRIKLYENDYLGNLRKIIKPSENSFGVLYFYSRKM